MKRLSLTLVALFAATSIFAQTLNVASYNVRVINAKDYESGNGWTQRVDYLCDLIRFSDFDIFGAQEVTDTQLKDMLIRLADYEYIGVGRDDGYMKGELSPIFYKPSLFKKLDGGTFWLSETPDKVSRGWDAKCRRVCSWGYLQHIKSKTKFWFFNLHMDHIGTVARRESSKLVIERITKMCGKGANVIITGDFNVPQTSESYRIFSECGFLRDCFEVADVKFAPTGTFNGFNPLNRTDRRIDHIWVTEKFDVERYGVLTQHYWSDVQGENSELTDAPKEIKAERRTQHLPSDHYPVNVFLRLK